jgi:hypothetical protein
MLRVWEVNENGTATSPVVEFGVIDVGTYDSIQI